MLESKIQDRGRLILHLIKIAVSAAGNAFATMPSAAARVLAVTILFGCASASAQTFATLYNFGSVSGDGADPQAGVVLSKSGNLYGTTSVGGIAGANGILFQLSPPVVAGDPWTETILHRFRGTPDGKIPECLVLVTPRDYIFGTTWGGGANDLGTAFESFPPTAPGAHWRERPIYSFGKPGDGANPNAGLLADKGKLYGVTFGGGADGKGTVFQLTPPSDPRGAWSETVLHSFAASGDAAFPSGDLVIDKKGNLYGVTTLGGVNNLGAVYELSPPAAKGDVWTEAVIFSFSGTDGTLPSGRLLIDASGRLYGTTDGGGSFQEGTVFQLTPPDISNNPWTEAVLWSFSGGRDGGNPQAGVVMNNGGLYGTTSTGGSGRPFVSGGVVFVLHPPAIPGDSWTEDVLHSFGGPDGFRPTAPLVLSKDVIYGSTSEGGLFGTGTVFALMP